MAEPKKRTRKNLTPKEREFVLRLIAEYRTGGYVTSSFQREFGRSIPSSLVTYYRQTRKDEIALYREQLRTAVVDIPIASKYWRLVELQSLYTKSNNYRLVRYVSGTDRAGNRTRVPIYEKPLGELRQLLTLAAQEMGDLREVVEVTSDAKDEFRAEFDTGETYSTANTPAASELSDESVN